MSAITLSLCIYSVIFLLCLLQWVVVKVLLYRRFHIIEGNLDPRKLSEKEKIRQKALVLFFLPLIVILLFLEKIPAQEMLVLSLVFLSLFFAFYLIINKVLR